MYPKVEQFTLPDILAFCNFKDATNPYYKEAAAESRAWANSFNVFTDRKRAFVMQAYSELLCSHVYSYAFYEQFRTCCDFVNLLFVVDEISDDQNGKDANATGQIFVNAMRDSNWDDGSLLAQMTKEFRARFVRYASPNLVRRFAKLCEDYTACVGTEAELREKGQVLDLASYIPLRRNNSAVILCFALAEFVLGIDLPDETFEDPDVMDAFWAACDLVCWSNDVYSYDMEQAKGHTGNNIVTVLMEEKGLSLQEASNYIGSQCKVFVDQYNSALVSLRSRGDSIHPDVIRFIEALSHWIIGNLVWSFESQRYFGSKHLEIKETLVVELRPREFLEEEPFSDSSSDSEDD